MSGAALSPGEPRTGKGVLTRDRARLVLTSHPRDAQAVIAAAERIVSGRRQFFGYPEIVVAALTDFNFDPCSGVRWPDRHGKRIDYRNVANADPKWIWELNRLQYLLLPLEAWLLSGREQFAAYVESEAVSWMVNSTPGRGVAWSNGYEAGIRAMSLATIYSTLRAEARISPSTESLFLRSLFQHGRWIERDPSTHSSANNHRVGELVGLASIGFLAPSLADAARWRADATRKLELEAGRQVLADGGSAEQAFTYGLYVADLLLWFAALHESQDIPAPTGVLSALTRTGHSLWAQLGPGESSPTYGDTDDARAYRLDAQDLRDPRDVGGAIASLVEHPFARSLVDRSDFTSAWLFGSEGQHRFRSTRPAGPPANVHLPKLGLVIFRTGQRRVLVDVGPLGYLAIAAHGHADALSISVTDGPESRIIDPGTGSYWRSPELRDAFRGTGFHATVTVDGLNQSTIGGPFLWTDHADTSLQFLDLDLRAVIAEHKGYCRLRDPVKHLRAVVVLNSGAVLVYDRLASSGSHTFSWAWPAPPDLAWHVTSDTTATLLKGGRRKLPLSIDTVARVEATVAHGQTDPPSGWWSPRFEVIEPTDHLVFRAHESTGFEMMTLIGAEAGEASLTVSRGGDSHVVDVTEDTEHTRILLNVDRAPPVQFL